MFFISIVPHTKGGFGRIECETVERGVNVESSRLQRLLREKRIIRTCSAFMG